MILDKFLYVEWKDSQDTERLEALYASIKETCKGDKTRCKWYLDFYKDVPNYFYILTYDEVMEAYPLAKNWLDIINYM